MKVDLNATEKCRSVLFIVITFKGFVSLYVHFSQEAHRWCNGKRAHLESGRLWVLS